MTKRIACIGDSITWGFFIAGRDTNSYPAVLGRLLGEGYEVRNFGYNDASVQRHADTPYWTKSVYKDSLEWRADIVIIMLGTNDTKRRNWISAKFREDYLAFVQTYLSLPSPPKVFLCTPPRMFRMMGFEMWGLHMDTLENEVIPIIKDIASSMGLPLIDTFRSISEAKVMVDGVHPGRKGAETLASFVYERLLEQL